MQNKTTKPEKTISLSNLPSIIIAVVLIVGIGTIYGLIGYLFSGIKENVAPTIQKPSLEIKDNYFGNEFIQIKLPQKNTVIENPVLISGKANVFEANVRVRILDDNKNILADDFITADGWMDKLYLFKKEIDYKMPQTENGLIEIFEESAKDGSDLHKIEIPVVFGENEDVFSDWEVYRNEEFGFEFDYPKEWGNYNKLEKGESFEKDRGKTYNFDNSDFRLSFEKKGFEIGNRFYAFMFDRLPAHFGEIIDVDNYCSVIEKKSNFIGLNLSCKVVELDNQKGILRDDIVCAGSPTGADVSCRFHRILLVKNKNLEYPLFIINTFLEYYYYYDSCDHFSEENDCFKGAEKKYKEVLEEYKDKTGDFNQILSTFKFIEEDEIIFQKSGEFEFFGTLTLTGYLDIKRWICNEGDMCTETVDYASFVFEDSSSDLIYDFLGDSKGNSFVGNNSVGIGCYEKDKDIIHSMNLGNSGRVENIISGEDLNKLLDSNKNNLVKLKLTKPAPAPGMGAPECYSHFRLFEVL